MTTTTTNHGGYEGEVSATSAESTSDELTIQNEIVGDDELDALLDDALSDFGKPPPAPTVKCANSIRNPPDVLSSSSASGPTDAEDMSQLWSEEFIKEATAQFEKKMREYAGQNQASPDTAGTRTGAASVSMSGDIYKVVEAATKAALSSGDPNLEATLNDAIKGLAVNPEVMNNPMGFSDDDLTKLMGSLGMGDAGGDKDMEDFLPFMSNMMQKLLSKELLQPVLVDIVDRYPDWLADNREKLPAADFDKYNAQYDSMRKICEEYSKEKPEDPEDVKQKRFDYVADLMLKVQAAGPPPKDLVGEEDGGALLQYDATMGKQCSIT